MQRHAKAIWNGGLEGGGGTISVQSGHLSDTHYSAKGRFEDEDGRTGTNPEELLAAAHAGCFAMQLSHLLALNGTPAEELDTQSVITIATDGDGVAVQSSALVLRGRVPSISIERFQAIAEQAKVDCPISKALGGLAITLDAALV